MKEIVLITGASGLIGKHLNQLLRATYEIRFLTRNPRSKQDFKWDLEKQYIDKKALENVSHIIHLAGENILKGRWTEDRKIRIISSRVNASKLIYQTLKENNLQIQTFVSASAIGYYGAVSSPKIFKEEDAPGTDFLAEVCVLWEKAADLFADSSICQRVVKLRTAVVFSSKNGAFAAMKKPIQYGIGAPIGSGRQFMPWIHIKDLCNMYLFALENKQLSGAYNASAPEQHSNAELTKAIAQVLKKPLFLPHIPSILIKIALGEASCMILEGSAVSTSKIEKAGFRFLYPSLQQALVDLV